MTDFAASLRRAAAPATTGPATDLSDIFVEEPVPLRVFIQDKAYLGNPELSPVQFDAIRHIERVYYQDLYPQMGKVFEANRKPSTLHVGSVSAWRDEPYWSLPVRMTNFITLQWAKGSSSPNTPVYNARTGQWVPLREWAQEDQVATAYPQDGKVFASAGSKAFREGHGRMLRVTTRKGHTIDVWEGHRFLSWNRRRFATGTRVPRFADANGVAWARTMDLGVGDPIAIATTLPEPTENFDVPDHEVELVGMWLGDGCMSNGNSLVCGVDAPLTRARAVELFLQYPQTQVKQVMDESDGSRRWKIYPKDSLLIKHSSGALARVARFYHLAYTHARDKKIPDEFYSLDNRQLAILLSRLVDTDGWVSTDRTGEIGYSTTSYELALGVQRIMLRLGAVAELKDAHIRYRGEPYLSYRVRVRDRRSLVSLATQLRLLDKDVKRLTLLERLAERVAHKQRAVHGDLMWDKIASIEELGEGEYWTLSVDGPAAYISSNGIYDHNSGKDHCCRVASMRIAYLLLCLHSPQRYYGIPDQDTIHLLNVASSSGQAQQAFFMPITRVVKSGWFADKCVPRQNTISYAKNIECISGHSDAESQEGLNLLLGIADEIDAFKSKKEMTQRRGASGREPTKSAEGILNMMRSSSSTRFPEVFKNVRISFPRYLGSTIQRLTAEAKQDLADQGYDSKHYVSGPLATWEVNPRVSGKEAFAAEYREDPVMARAKYECRPSRAVNPYFRNQQAVDSAFEYRRVMPLNVSYDLEHSAEAGAHVWVPKFHFAADFHPVRGAAYVMHGDLAVAADRAGIAMAHVAGYSEHDKLAEDDDGAYYTLRETRPHVKVDFVIPFAADTALDPPREIQIRWARQLCFELIRRGFNIRRFTFDYFQSTDTMQILRSKGIECERMSTDTSEDPWRNLRDLMYEGRITIPRPMVMDPDNPPEFLLREELFSLTRMQNGRIDHPSDSSKDQADALACAALGAVIIGGSEEEGGAKAQYEQASFEVGTMFALPIGARPAAQWVTELPAMF